jgi:hypothetical protein
LDVDVLSDQGRNTTPNACVRGVFRQLHGMGATVAAQAHELKVAPGLREHLDSEADEQSE